MPLEPGVIAQIAAMASHFGQRQCKSKTQEQPTQPASTQTAPPQKPRNSFFFFPGGRGGGGGQGEVAVTSACGQLSLNPVSPYRYTQSPSPLLTALCQAL